MPPESGEETASFLDWKRAHAELERLAKTRAEFDAEEGQWLLYALRSGAHVQLGYSTFAEYIERLFGYAPRWTGEKLRVAESLEELPEFAQALRDGLLNWSSVRELTRVATRDTESEWVDAARGRTARQVEQLVSGHRPGDRPGGPVDARLQRHVLRLEVSAEALATFRQAVAKLRRDTQGPLDEEAAVLMMARHVLAGSADSGRANYQTALTVCDRCGRGFQQGRGELVEVGSEIVEMAECDAQHIGHTHVGEESNGSEAGAPKRAGTRPGRARQTIPPAIRRLVMRRDGGRCAAPGCKNAVFLDIHHLDPIAEGGDHDPDRLLLLCGAHHRAQHRGQLIIKGTVSTGFAFRHADGTTYGGTVSPRIAEAHALAFRALRSLGFSRDGRARCSGANAYPRG